MFQKILVVVDRSEASQQVFQTALTLAQTMGGKLLLLHIISPREKDDPSILVLSSCERSKDWNTSDTTFLNAWVSTGEVTYRSGASKLYHDTTKHKAMTEITAELESPMLNQLQVYQAIATAAGVPADLTQHSGNPGRTICHVARLYKADVIVMGLPESRLSDVTVGGISHYVMHYATCPVLIVPEKKSESV